MTAEKRPAEEVLQIWRGVARTVGKRSPVRLLAIQHALELRREIRERDESGR